MEKSALRTISRNGNTTSRPGTHLHTRLGSERRCFAYQSRNARTNSGRPDIAVPSAGKRPCFDSAAICRSGPRRPARQPWISLAVASGGQNSALIFEPSPPPQPLIDRRAPNSSSPLHCPSFLRSLCLQDYWRKHPRSLARLLLRS